MGGRTKRHGAVYVSLFAVRIVFALCSAVCAAPALQCLCFLHCTRFAVLLHGLRSLYALALYCFCFVLCPFRAVYSVSQLPQNHARSTASITPSAQGRFSGVVSSPRPMHASTSRALISAPAISEAYLSYSPISRAGMWSRIYSESSAAMAPVIASVPSFRHAARLLNSG